MQLTREEIIEKLKQIMVAADSKNAEMTESFREDANLFTDLGLTSIGMLYMVIAIEESFGIRFDNVGMNDFNTLGDVVSYIEGKLK